MDGAPYQYHTQARQQKSLQPWSPQSVPPHYNPAFLSQAQGSTSRDQNALYANYGYGPQWGQQNPPAPGPFQTHSYSPYSPQMSSSNHMSRQHPIHVPFVQAPPHYPTGHVAMAGPSSASSFVHIPQAPMATHLQQQASTPHPIPQIPRTAGSSRPNHERISLPTQPRSHAPPFRHNLSKDRSKFPPVGAHQLRGGAPIVANPGRGPPGGQHHLPSGPRIRHGRRGGLHAGRTQNAPFAYNGHRKGFIVGPKARSSTNSRADYAKSGPQSSTNRTISKKDENRRTLTDFKIIGWCIPELSWQWGDCPDLPSTENSKTESAIATESSKEEASTDTIVSSESRQQPTIEGRTPPSRLRFYFDTIEETSVLNKTVSGDSPILGEKRKKLDDDDDLQERKTRPRQSTNIDSFEHPETEGGVTRTDRQADEGTVDSDDGDWLMAAIGEDPDDEDGFPTEKEVEDPGTLGESHCSSKIESTGRSIGKAVADSLGEEELMLINSQQGASDGRIPSQCEVLEVSEFNNKGESTRTQNAFHGCHEAESQRIEQYDDPLEKNGDSGPTILPDLSIPASGSSPEAVATLVPSVTPPLGLKTEANSPLSPGTLADPKVDNIEDAIVSPTLSQRSLRSSLFGSSTPISQANGSSSAIPIEENDGIQQANSKHMSNRLSILYAEGRRRLILDADIIQNIKLFRSSGKFEVKVSIEKSSSGYSGVALEVSDDEKQEFSAIDFQSPAATESSVPPFHRLIYPTVISMSVFLDTHRPFSEPGWCKSGKIDEWLRGEVGTDSVAVEWHNKIQVTDPDKPQDMQDLIENWVLRSSLGTRSEREHFNRSYLSEKSRCVEILLRVVRGERMVLGPPQRQHFTGPQASALLPSSQLSLQNSTSAAVLAIAEIAVDYAKQALGESGKSEAFSRFAEVIQSLPLNLIQKALDSLFRDWPGRHNNEARGASRDNLVV